MRRAASASRSRAGNWAYTDVVPRPREIRPRHSVENQWDLLAPVLPGLDGPAPTRDPVTMVHAPEADASIDAWMRPAKACRPPTA